MTLLFRAIRVSAIFVCSSDGATARNLPGEFQSELNLARYGEGLIECGGKRTAVKIEHRVVLAKRVQEAGRCYVSPSYIGIVYAAISRNNDAIEWL